MKKFMKLAAVVLALALMLPLAGCTGNGNVLRVGMECNYAPYNWTQADDSNGAVPIEGGGYAGGYDVEIAKKVAEGLGKELVIVKVDWSLLKAYAKSGKIDAIIAGMSMTMDRQDALEFSNKYYTADLTLVVRKDGPFAAATSIKDFEGAKITAQENTTHSTAINQLTGIDKQANSSSFPDMIAALAAGTIDGYIAEVPSARAAVALNPNFTYITFAEGQGFDIGESYKAICVGVKRRSKLLEDINTIVNGISVEDQEAMMDKAIANQPK